MKTGVAPTRAMQPPVAKSVGARDNGVSRSNLQSHQDGQERIRSGGNADGIRRTAVVADRLFECRCLWPENKALAGKNFVELSTNRLSERAVLFAKVQQRHAHGWETMAASPGRSIGSLAPYPR
jgi:hypothetical protein